MNFDRALGDVQVGGDLPIGSTGRELGIDGSFPVGERIEHSVASDLAVRLGQQRHELVDQTAGCGRGEHGLAAGHGANRGKQLRRGGDLTGPNPVDRGKSGSKIHVLSDRAGIPLAVGVSAANTNDAQALKPLIMAVPAVRSRRGPRRRKPAKLHADKAYDIADLRRWVRDRGIAVRIARKGLESSQHLGRHRWVIERTISWLTGYHRLNLRFECKGIHFCAFLTLAAALTCYKKLTKAKAAT